MDSKMMNKDKYIPQGYKPSPLGIIPEDWEVKRLGECTNLLTNGFVGVATPHYTEDSDGITYIQGYNVTEGGFNLRGIKKVTKVFHNKNSKSSLLEGDLLTIQTGDIGLTTIVPKDLEGSNCHALIISRFNNSIIPRFMLYYYNSSIGRERFRKIETGTTMKHINTGDLINFLVPVPSIEEQKAIVDLLKLWDTAIAKQTALIEKLTLRKRGLMQQLLTGKKRLKGFSGEWKEVRLGEVASINRGGSPRPIEDYITDGEGYNWIKIGDVGVDAKYITSTEEKIIKEGLSKTRFVKSGDFILSNSMSFGRPYILKLDGCIHDGWLVIQEYSQTFNIDFLYYILGYDTTLAQYKSMAAGSGVLNLNKEIVKEVQLRIPSIDEQIVIASILVNADKEIEIQKQKLAAMQAQKKGLMQVLLSGKRRVK